MLQQLSNGVNAEEYCPRVSANSSLHRRSSMGACEATLSGANQNLIKIK